MCMCVHVRLGEVLEEPVGLLRLALGLHRRKHVQVSMLHSFATPPPKPNTDAQYDDEEINHLTTTYLLRTFSATAARCLSWRTSSSPSNHTRQSSLSPFSTSV